jgi:hypothetical protein
MFLASQQRAISPGEPQLLSRHSFSFIIGTVWIVLEWAHDFGAPEFEDGCRPVRLVLGSSTP